MTDNIMSSGVSQYATNQDKRDLLDQLNPSKELQNIINSMLGLNVSIVRNGNREDIITVRTNKPMFTDEYVRDIGTDLSYTLNFTIQVSRFEQERIYTKIHGYLHALRRDLATHGDDNYISHDSWKKILDIHADKVYYNEKTGEWSQTQKDGYKVVSGWYRFGIKWDYNKPVNCDMLQLVKTDNEERDQAIKFLKIIHTFSAIMEASYNKSYSSANQQQLGMLLYALGEIRTETTNIQENKKSKFSMFGRSKEQNNQEWA